MRLARVEQAASSRTFQELRLGPWELGWCTVYDKREGFCGTLVRDDGTGYADLDGVPFKAYVCKQCGDKLIGESK
jgi:hypothetical protein